MITLKNTSNIFPESNGAVLLSNLGKSFEGLGKGVQGGLILSNNGTDATNDLDLSAGWTKDSTGKFILAIDATHVKQADVAFAEYTVIGTASGGRDSADNLTGAKWFRVFLIGGAGKNDQMFLSTTAAPTLPSGFTHYGQVSWAYWDGSTLKPFTQKNDDFVWTTPILLDDDDPGVSAVLGTVLCPPLMEAKLTLGIIAGAGGAVMLRVSDPAQADIAPSATVAPLSNLRALASETRHGGPIRVRTNASSQVRYRVSFSEATMKAQLLCEGFIGRGDR